MYDDDRCPYNARHGEGTRDQQHQVDARNREHNRQHGRCQRREPKQATQPKLERLIQHNRLARAVQFRHISPRLQVLATSEWHHIVADRRIVLRSGHLLHDFQTMNSNMHISGIESTSEIAIHHIVNRYKRGSSDFATLPHRACTTPVRTPRTKLYTMYTRVTPRSDPTKPKQKHSCISTYRRLPCQDFSSSVPVILGVPPPVEHRWLLGNGERPPKPTRRNRQASVDFACKTRPICAASPLVVAATHTAKTRGQC